MAFKLADGCIVPDMTGIEEGYGIRTNDAGEYWITVNVSAENIEDIFLGLSALVSEPTFGIVEVPTHRSYEEELSIENSEHFHKDTYFRDNTGVEDLKMLLNLNADLFIHDGILKFGFACKKSRDEVYVGKYKVFRIFTNDARKYVQYLRGRGFSYREPLRTVWDNFTNERPGECHRLTRNGEDAFALVDRLVGEGFLFHYFTEDGY
ncbi:MAG: hypothetical protein HY851_06630 [candidate division Zixibacteria bacterium]|nr:hypothetical protein [candidate division Zixibacteria bacterium]